MTKDKTKEQLVNELLEIHADGWLNWEPQKPSASGRKRALSMGAVDYLI